MKLTTRELQTLESAVMSFDMAVAYAFLASKQSGNGNEPKQPGAKGSGASATASAVVTT